MQAQFQPQYPEQEQLKCPRCDSTNTKFCYYNNYNLSQPRHFCKSCKRYWTKGGALRNIPVGGGGGGGSASRKNAKRSSSKRPASVSESTDKKGGAGDQNNSSNGEMGETLPLMGDNLGGQFGNFVEVGGSFSSLLGSSGEQYVGLLDELAPSGSSLDHFGHPGSGLNVNPSGNGGGGSGGDTACWGGGGDNEWPDLAIYTPGSTFQ